MKKIQEKENKVVFQAEVEESLANAIRRYMNQIPVLGIDEIEIVKNGSALYDEVVAHRVGLIPVKGKTKSASLKLSSNKEGFVHAGELKGSADVVYGDIPITYLDKGQEIEFAAYVKEGKGVEHIKFSPGIMFYRNVSEISLDKNLKDVVKKICPECEIKEKGNKIVISDNKTKEVADVLEGLASKNNKEAEVETKENNLIINVESFGQLSIKDMIKNSVDALKKDLTEVAKKIK